MKKYLMLLLCVAVAGCGHKRDSNREVLAKLDGIRAELAKQPSAPRWATANKREIEMAITQWTSAQSERAKAQEQLTPEQQQKVAQYDSLQAERGRLQMRLMQENIMQQNSFPHRVMRSATSVPIPPPSPFQEIETNADYAALTSKIAEAPAPIADILDRRDRLSAKLRNQYKPEGLIAEYAKDRFDLVLDSSDARFSGSPVLYQKTGEVTDITDGVIQLFKEKSGE